MFGETSPISPRMQPQQKSADEIAGAIQRIAQRNADREGDAVEVVKPQVIASPLTDEGTNWTITGAAPASSACYYLDAAREVARMGWSLAD